MGRHCQTIMEVNMARGRKPKPIQLTLDKTEMNAILHALKKSIDSVQDEDMHCTDDGNVHPSSYSELAIQMALFVRVAERYKTRFCKDQS